MSRLPLAALVALATTTGVAIAACSSSATPTAASDGGTILDARADIASADAKVGDVCAFNRECGISERCECDETTGACTCRTGPRGVGANGVSACTSGNDCASSLCVEGERNKFFCSDECTSSTGCGPALPVCADIALVGRICIRNADGG